MYPDASPQPSDRGSGGFSNKPGHHVPQSVVTVGMWLFLAALTMLFVASLIGYIFIRNQNRARYGVTLHFPPLLWASSVMVVGVSFTLSRAMASLRREKQPQFRMWIKLALALGIGFVVVQAPAMGSLLMTHLRLRSTGMALYGLLFSLILLHALHVVGGLFSLVIVTRKGLRGAYDHEHFAPVGHAAMYWHFLDIVWLVMFTTFLLVG